MSLSANISTGLVKGRFGDRVVAGPNGEKLLIPARGRIEFEGMTPFSSFPLATPDPITMLRPRGSGILDGEGYLCTLDPADEDKPGERMVLLQAPNDPDSTVQGWTWRATLRFVNADGTRVQNTLETFTFDLPFGDVPFDLAQVVSVPESPGIGKEQAIIYAASAQAAAVSAADDAGAARRDADVSAAAAVSAAAGVEGARADAESARFSADRAGGLIATAEGSAGAAASSAARAELEAETAKVAANAASAAAGRSADESAAARSAAAEAVTASAEAASTANSAKTVATGVESRANSGEFKGTKGDTGPANKLTIGTVTKADTPSATITGTAPNQTLNLQLPKGDTGPAVTLRIGTVESGVNAAASITGTGATQTLNLAVPKGEPGGWNAGTNLGTTDLDTVITPGLYWSGSTSATLNPALHYPAMTDPLNHGSPRGTLQVQSWSGGNSVIQTYTRLGSGGDQIAQRPRVVFQRYKSGSWSEWNMIAVTRAVRDAGGNKVVEVWDDEGSVWVPLAGPGGLTAPTKLTHTTDLNTLFTPGHYAITSAAAPNLPVAVSGTLTVNARYLQGETYGPSITQHFVPFFGSPTRESQVEYRRTFTGDAWQPWRAHTAQRVDNTAGRAIYTWDETTNREQMIYGDTGWRTVSASTALQPIWNTTTLRLRRVGNVVDFVFLGTGPIDPAVIGLDIQGFRAIHADDVPSAFRPSANAYNMGFGRFSQSSGSASPRQYVMCVMNASGGMHFEKDETAPNGVLLGASSSIYVSGCYTTNSAWPTSLPGTASA